MPYVGQRFGRYRIEEEIGAGGMGVVYRAYDEKLERDLAIKVLTPGALNDESARKQFRNEARVLSRLNHPCIQTIHDFDTFDGYFNGGKNNDVAGFGAKPSAGWNDLGLAGIDAKVAFSPHSAANAKLGEIAADIKSTTSSLLYSLAFLYESPGVVLDAIKAVTTDNNIFVKQTHPFPEDAGGDFDVRSVLHEGALASREDLNRPRHF